MSSVSEPIKKVERNADQDWFLTATHCLRIVAREHKRFTSDDVWECLRNFNVETHNPRAMGPVFKNAYRDNLIVPLDRWQESRRRIAHRRPVRVWESLMM